MRDVVRNAGALALGVALVVSAPAAAQMYSDGYKFLKAVKDKDGGVVNDLLDAPGGSTIVNSRDITSGETALHIATARRDLTWLQFLLGRGANPNIADKRGATPLMLACQVGFIEGVQVLAKSGARVDTPNSAGETPLISAVHRRDIALMRVLLQAGANPDRPDNSGRTARDYAALDGANSILTGEIERNAKVSGGDKPSYGPSL